MTIVPDIIVPADPDMAEEPALTIGELFANKTMIQPVIAALLAVIASITGWVADDDLVTNVTTIVTFVAVAWGVIAAQVTASRRSMQQARQTREAVYAPATVAAAVDAERGKEAYVTGDPLGIPRQPGAPQGRR